MPEGLAAPPPSLGRKLKYLFEYAALLAIATPLATLPRASALACGRKIGALLYCLFGSRQKIASHNLKLCFPEKSDREVRDIVRACWENLGVGAADFVRLPRLSKQELDAYKEVEGEEYLLESYRRKRGVLIITGHYGEWELGVKYFPSIGMDFAVVARRIKNPWVDQWVTRIRSSSGARVILARNAVKESVKWLKEGKALAVLVDHRVKEGEMKVPFFGRPAFTTFLPALLALRYGVPVHPARCWREGDRVQIRVEPAMDFSGLDSGEKGLYEATLRMNQVVERWIRERPSDWLWIHNRWKT